MTGHVRDGHLVGLYLHSLSSCSSILGSWNGQPETLNLHLVLWPLNKKLVSINLLIRWFHESCFHQSQIIFHQIYCLFWPTQNGFLFENQNTYTKKCQSTHLFLSKEPKQFMKKTITNRQSIQELWKQDSWNHLMSRSHVQVPKLITWDWFLEGSINTMRLIYLYR